MRLTERNWPSFSLSLVYIGSNKWWKHNKLNNSPPTYCRGAIPHQRWISLTSSVSLLLNFHPLIVQGSEFSSAVETEKKKLQTYIVHVEQPEVGVLGPEN